MFHDRLANPVNLGVVSYGIMRGVHQDHLVKLVDGVLAYPVAVEHPESPTHLSHSFLGHGLERALELPLQHTVRGGLTVDLALDAEFSAVASTHTHSPDHVALLRPETEFAGLVWAGGPRSSMDGLVLSVLPGTNS